MVMTEWLCLNCERRLTNSTKIDKQHDISNSFFEGDIFAHYFGLLLGRGLEPLASALASRSVSSLTSLAVQSLYQPQPQLIL